MPGATQSTGDPAWHLEGYSPICKASACGTGFFKYLCLFQKGHTKLPCILFLHVIV